MTKNAAAAKSSVATWWNEKDHSTKAIVAAKTGVAAVLSILLANLLGLSHAYWAAISAIVVLGWDSTVTVASCRDRVVGTAMGACLGWATSYLWHGHYVFYGVSIALCIFVCSGLQFDKAGGLAAATLTLIVIVQSDSSPGHVALARFLETVIGVAMALFLTLLPPHATATDAKAAT